MRPFSKILVPVDFSACSEEAIRYAADLSRRYDAPLTLLHVNPPPNYGAPEALALMSPEQIAALVTELEGMLAGARVSAHAAGAVGVETALVHGLVVSEILDQARRRAPDLIVMGTHGRTGLSHALMGSVAEKIVQKAPCPVLTVRPPK